MKKTFPHKAHLASVPSSYNSQSSLANALKAIVSSQLKLDKKTTEDTGRSMERTGSTRKASITARLPKAMNQSSNSLLEDQSVRVIRNIVNEEISREFRAPARQKTAVRDNSKETVADTIASLRREVAELREEINRKSGTENQQEQNPEKQPNLNLCLSDTWTQKCLTQTSSQIMSPSELQFRTAGKQRSQFERRLEALEDSVAEDRLRIGNQLNQRFALSTLDLQKCSSQLAERLLVCENQQQQLRCQLLGLRSSFGTDKHDRIDRLESNLINVMGKMDTLEHSRRQTGNSNIIQIRSYSTSNLADSNCCKKETQELKREFNEIKSELRSMNKLIGMVGEQTDRYANFEAELKEQMQRVEARSDTKTLSEKIGQFEQQLSQHADYVEMVECKISKNYRQCEEAVTKFTQVEGRLEQLVRRPELELLTTDFKEAVETMQTEVNAKLMTIITEYNENFLSIENSICDLKDIFFENLQINKHLTQKLQSVCRYQASESHQLQELYKTSDDVYSLLENNIQRICELSKKEMCFEHEFKELREKVEVADSMHQQNNPRRRMTSSFSSSFSEMKSKIMGELKGDPHYPRDSFKRTNLNCGRQMTTLMDESIQDQSGEFDRD